MGHQWPPALVNQRPSRQNQSINRALAKRVHTQLSDCQKGAHPIERLPKECAQFSQLPKE